LAHCPERVNPGDPKWTVANIPRVIGAYSAPGMKLAYGFYHSILDAPIKKMGSVNEAEAVKILENTFRDINIAFVNEMAKSFAKLNIDITNVIAGASTKPFAFLSHYPGNGVGGHCISVDPYYMIERGRQAGFDHEFLKLARTINDSMPA
jgi:nucleotide sugar dehydrogenase